MPECTWFVADGVGPTRAGAIEEGTIPCATAEAPAKLSHTNGTQPFATVNSSVCTLIAHQVYTFAFI